METFDAGKLFIFVTGLSNLAHNHTEWKGLAILAENYQSIKNNIDFVCSELERMDLKFSLDSARQLHTIIHNEATARTTEPLPTGDWMVFPPLAAGRYRHASTELVNRFRVELSTKMVMILPSNKVGYFDGSEDTFPTAVRDSFSSAEYDMDEAGKCFALSRYTASVFHAMRVLEVGLHTLGADLGLSVAPNWGSAIKNIENEIKSPNIKIRFPNWKTDDEPFYSEAATHFRMVKNAWRNHTMHGNDHYDAERARDILSSVSSFMRHLAKRLKE